MTVDEGWEKTDFLHKVDGKLHLKRSHKYYFQAQGGVESSGYYYCVLLFGLPRVNPI